MAGIAPGHDVSGRWYQPPGAGASDGAATFDDRQLRVLPNLFVTPQLGDFVPPCAMISDIYAHSATSEHGERTSWPAA
jgi:hypothetical protein